MEKTPNIERLLNIKRVADRMSVEIFHFTVLPKYINERGYKMGVEIGVAYAGHCEYILAKCPGLSYLVGVDPYKYKLSWSGINNQADIDDMYLIAKNCTKNDKRFLLIRESSNDFFRSNSFQFDFVFIDGDHDYEQVREDIHNASLIISPGGLLSGHDYKNFPGVTQAVDEFSKQTGKPVIEEAGTVWMINY
jgi:hypothetical protein